MHASALETWKDMIMNKQLTKEELAKVCGGQVIWQREFRIDEIDQPGPDTNDIPMRHFTPQDPQPGGNLV
jgi:hypothetical protein